MDGVTAHPRAFRFGALVGGVEAGGDWGAIARGVTSLGYSTLVMPDHLNGQLSPLPALAAAAEADATLRVGTLALANDLRHPLVVARDAATVDIISGGRFELGVGAGWMQDDYDQAGIAFEPPGTRIRRLAEAVSVIRGAWEKPDFSFQGRYYSVALTEPGPVPVQRPVPLLIGGGGRQVLSLAGREADIVGINPNLRSGVLAAPGHPQTVVRTTDEQVRWVREAAGDRYPQLELNVLLQVVHVGDDAPTDRPDDGSPWVTVGDVSRIVDLLEERRARWDISYICVPGAALVAFAPVVERLARG